MNSGANSTRDQAQKCPFLIGVQSNPSWPIGQRSMSRTSKQPGRASHLDSRRGVTPAITTCTCGRESKWRSARSALKTCVSTRQPPRTPLFRGRWCFELAAAAAPREKSSTFISRRRHAAAGSLIGCCQLSNTNSAAQERSAGIERNSCCGLPRESPSVSRASCPRWTLLARRGPGKPILGSQTDVAQCRPFADANPRFSSRAFTSGSRPRNCR